MSRKEKLSVVILASKAESFLDLCLLSLVGQDKLDLDVILVDNSPNESLERSIEFWKQRDLDIRAVFVPCKSIGYALNQAIDKADSDYLMFMYGTDIIDNADVLYESCLKANALSLDMVVSPIAWRYDEITTSFPCHIINFCKEYFPTKDVFSYEELGRNFHLLSAPDICNRLFRTSLLREKGLKFNEDIYDPVFSFLINTAECSKRISLCPKHIVRHYCRSPFHHLECEGMVNTYKEFCSSKGIDTGSVKTIESYGFSFLSYVTYHLSKTRPLSEFIRCSNGLGEVMAMFDFSCVPVIPQCVHSMWRFLTSISLVDGDSDKLGDCYCRAYWDDCFSSYNDVWRKPFKVVYTLKQRIYLKLRDSLTRFMRIDLNYLGSEIEL